MAFVTLRRGSTGSGRTPQLCHKHSAGKLNPVVGVNDLQHAMLSEPPVQALGNLSRCLRFKRRDHGEERFKVDDLQGVRVHLALGSRWLVSHVDEGILNAEPRRWCPYCRCSALMLRAPAST